MSDGKKGVDTSAERLAMRNPYHWIWLGLLLSVCRVGYRPLYSGCGCGLARLGRGLVLLFPTCSPPLACTEFSLNQIRTKLPQLFRAACRVFFQEVPHLHTDVYRCGVASICVPI